MEKRKALISVWDKEGIVELAKGLAQAGYEIVSSSGTAKHLSNAGLDVIEVVDLTGVPAILGGRVKTLHPKVMGGILARRGAAQDDEDRKAHDIPLIDIVVCTLYPFEETYLSGADLDALIEKIDIGGVSLIRAAAKNYYHVGVVTDPADYPRVLQELEREGELSNAFRQELALKAFAVTSAYDATIYKGLMETVGLTPPLDAETKVLPLRKAQELRYGENPHQRACLYLPALAPKPFVQLAGKELSYNNLLDLDTVLRGAGVFQDAPACTIVKHTSPCGTAVAGSVAEAYRLALVCDAVSAFGGILSFTRELDLETAQLMCEHFYEVAAAPSIAPEALELLKTKKPNLRVLKIEKPLAGEQITSGRAGFLVQEDTLAPLPSLAAGKWVGVPREDLWDDLIFAWKTATITKSNSIVLAKDGASLGIGGGFTNRVDAVNYAINMAKERAQGCVLASDAFFPFADSIELAAKAGVAAIIQPGGSMRDAEVIEAAEKLGVSMFMGSHRVFRH